jgi:glycosyltransferase involved in cell wall biosynthesis
MCIMPPTAPFRPTEGGDIHGGFVRCMSMRIAQVGLLAGPGAIAGGVWQVQRTQSAALVAAGHEVRALAGWLGPLPNRVVEPFELDLIRVRQPLPGIGLRGLWSIHLHRALHNVIGWADVAHVHLCRDFVTVPAVRLFRDAGLPVVAQTHGMLTPPRNRLQIGYDRLVVRDTLSLVDTYLYLTEDERIDLQALAIPSEKLRRIDNATPGRLGSWQDPSEPELVFASRLHRRKQPLVFVDAALRLLAQTTATFTIAGPDQGEERAVRSSIAAAEATGRFRVLGGVEHDALMGLLSKSTAMVLPSIDEPYPMIVVEALSMGVPTIVTKNTGIRKLLADADAALLADPVAEDIAIAMQKVIGDAALRASLSARGRKLYESAWQPASLAKRLAALYEQVIRRSGGRTGIPRETRSCRGDE